MKDLVIIPYSECGSLFVPTTPEFQEDFFLSADLIDYATKQVTDLLTDFRTTF